MQLLEIVPTNLTFPSPHYYRCLLLYLSNGPEKQTDQSSAD
jgi:hypothetical protein